MKMKSTSKPKRFLSLFLSLLMVLTCGLLSGCGASGSAGSSTASSAAASGGGQDGITIGVSIWGTSDSLGSSCKAILDAAADALGVKLVYNEQELVSEKVISGVENLCAAGVDGIIICNSADSEMSSVIRTCDSYGVYVSQFFRTISDSEVNDQALASKYYLGCTHEDEYQTGYNLGKILIEKKGARHIGWTAWRVGDATSLARQEGYKAAVEEWNAAHSEDPVELYPLVDDKYTSEEARAAVEGLIDTYPKMDSLIVVGGGGMALDGALSAIAGRNKVGQYAVVSTDFTTNLGDQLAGNEIAAMSGGHYADPLFSFMMVYNAIMGNYNRTADQYLEVKFPMLYVASSEDYANYKKYFVDSLPYNADELKAMANSSFADLQKTAASLSIEDVAARHG